MKARIYKPVRNPMQSGEAHTNEWLLEFVPTAPLFTDPLMGWTGQTDTTQQLKLYFATKEEAVGYAESKGIEFEITEPKKPKTIKPKSYSANFAFKQVS